MTSVEGQGFHPRKDPPLNNTSFVAVCQGLSSGTVLGNGPFTCTFKKTKLTNLIEEG